MFFNSLDFGLFLPIVFCIYWFVFGKSRKAQNIFIIVASYFFYGCWDWRFLLLIAFSTGLDFFLGKEMQKSTSDKRRKLLLRTSLVVNLGLLGFFKYFNFFVDSFVSSISLFGYEFDGLFIDILLPVGISFYTFQTLSYSLDVYRKDIEATQDFTEFAAYVSFFPQLVAGPIERATDFLPQFQKDRRFDYSIASDGMRQILWGLFKKVLIADNAAKFANQIFDNHETFDGPMLFIGTIFFGFQIYGDFSGYSDMAIGTAKLFGFDLRKNFSYPYFSESIQDYWRRWHISLNTWFNDYLFMPLSLKYRTKGKVAIVASLLVTFLLSGLWHGANWTYVVWGGLNGIYFLPSQFKRKKKKGKKKKKKKKEGFKYQVTRFTNIGITFTLTCFAWVFFRSESLGQAFTMFRKIGADLLSKESYIQVINTFYWDITFRVPIILLCFITLEWFCQKFTYPLEGLRNVKFKALRYAIYLGIILLVFFEGNFGERIEFIYFQF